MMENWMTGVDGIDFYTRFWTVKEGTPLIASVLFLHGYNDHISRYDYAFSELAQEGIQVFGYDQRGFGKTAKKANRHGVMPFKDAYKDISFFLGHLQTVTPSKVPIFLMGQSMGGGLSLGFLTQRLSSSESLSGSLIFSPMIRQAPETKALGLTVKLGTLVSKIAPNLPVYAPVVVKYLSRDPAKQKEYVEDPLCKSWGTFKSVADMLQEGNALLDTKAYEKFPDIPLMVFHGASDKITDPKASKEFVEGAKNRGKHAELMSFEGFYHELFNEPEADRQKVIDETVSWIKSKL